MKSNTLISCLLIIALSSLLFSCENSVKQARDTDLVIFFINDNHAQIENFSKIKSIIDESAEKENVIIVHSGDMFSGNPLVDFHQERGYPVIDLMNRIGFDVAALGNHEFDYGQEVLKERIDQAEFEILCANMKSESPLLEEVPASYTINKGGLKISFVGVIETNGKPGTFIPSTHPNKLEGLTFYDAGEILGDYSDFKDEQEADLLILLSHLGHDSDDNGTCDYKAAGQFPFFDAIIGGHSHSIQDTTINGVHIYQSGAYLNYLGKITLTVKKRKIISEDFELINLDEYPSGDYEIQSLIDSYNNNPIFSEVIGTNSVHMTRNRTVGCFYTDALRGFLATDMSIQNPGGIRSDLDEGEITILEIYRIDPFNNDLMEYEMTAGEIRAFLEGSGAGFYYSGVILKNDPGYGVLIKDLEGNIYEDEHILTIAINDYIPEIYENYFPDPSVIYDMSTADAMIQYVRDLTVPLHYENCNRYFRYQE
ncbi:MAG: bifunctional UDP-sugar hydrolase/5'-nucleotidase [Bacteroidales bacterium]|nr:bifunctional UDP-sugar hydrolase/5'-nucleotidase [Bacteroidales bacterium]